MEEHPKPEHVEPKNIDVPITNDLEKRIADAFEIFDHSGTKTADVREIGTIIRSLGCCPSEAEIQEILVAVEDPSVSGSVHLVKFLPYMCRVITEHKFQPATPDKLLEAFHVLDPEGRGYLTYKHMSDLMMQEGEPFTQDEVDEMMETALDPHTKNIPYEYYINQLMHEPSETDDIYKLADKIEAAKPPPPPAKKTFSRMMKSKIDIQEA